MYRQHLVAPLALCAALQSACSPAQPPAEPSPPAPPPPAAGVASAAPATGAAAPASAAPAAARSTVKVLEEVGGVTAASYAPRGFDRLTPGQRALAYHLAQAALAGDPLFTMQTSRYAWPATELMIQLLAQKEKLEPALRDRLATYRKMLFLHHGLHDARTGQKLVPPFSQQELEGAARALNIAVSKDLLAGLFDPKVAPVVTNKTPGKGKDPVLESAANHYEGVNSKDLEKFKEKYELNGRIVKKGGKLVEEVYRAGGDGAPPGVGAKELGRVVKHLEAAVALAPPVQQGALQHLIRYLKTGEPGEFTEHDVTWLKQAFPVDYILGFIETYNDVRARKGGFEGIVFIADPERDPPLQALARSAQYFEQKMPWEARWKRDAFQVPAAAAVVAVAATGDGGPFTFGGVNLPNAQAIREKHGSKNFVLLSTMDTREALTYDKTIDEFAPEEVRAEIRRCGRHLSFAATSFHEVTGHGSGKVNPDLKADPAELLAPYYSALEESRAERVADWLTGDPKTVEIGILPDAACARVFPAYAATLQLTMLRNVPQGDVAEEDHLRAELIAFGWVKDRGAVAVEVRQGKTFFVVKDPDAWRKASGELLAELHRIKATGDREALKALVERYGSRINPAWRDEVLARLKALNLPRTIATIPPMLTPIRDAAGKVVDAKAEQTTSLDAYIAALEQVWAG
ncbi:dipeptidyl-peptidase 3 family protein [Sorangium sp. So ce1099]|uniref:dipeptidyl-peptidase 3 family protein n=1 Tax=Sorangium sp. So ce1099 TaxID=3133331 RepID=UPI003F5FFB75